MVYSLDRLRRQPQIKDDLKNDDDIKNEDDFKNEDDLKNKYNLNFLPLPLNNEIYWSEMVTFFIAILENVYLVVLITTSLPPKL